MDRACNLSCKERKQLDIRFAERTLGIALLIGFEDSDQVAAIYYGYLQHGAVWNTLQAWTAIRPVLVIIENDGRPGLGNATDSAFAHLYPSGRYILGWEHDV